MSPDAGEGTHPGRRFGLGDFAVVMRKDQVGAAAVHIDLLAEVFERHRRAFDVPAGAPVAPGAGPAGFGGGARLPQDEIQWVLLARIVGIRATLRRQFHHLLAAQPAQPPIVRDAPHPEVDVAVALVGVTLRLEPTDELGDLWDGLTGP